MRNFGCASFLAIAGVALAMTATAAEGVAGNWRLFDHTGGSHELYRHKDREAVLLYSTATKSELAKADFAALQALRADLDENTLSILALASQPDDSRAALSSWNVANEAGIPVLVDEAQFAAHAIGATHDAEAILLNTDDWSIAYRGPLRDGDALQGDLSTALSALTSGKAVQPIAHDALGSAIQFKNLEDAPNYTDHVAPILAKNCVQCHSEGNIGPFAMDSYRKVSGWAPMIRETVVTKRMPPWHADPHVGAFTNEVGLSTEEAQTIVAWVDGGTPRGEGEDILRIAASEAADADGWMLGEPDYVVSMPRVEELPAQGVFDYRYQRARVKIDGDKWVKGVEVRPDNAEALHHALIFVQYPQEYAHLQPEYHGGAGGYFAGYAPGTLPIFYPEDSGKFLPDGSTIIFQMHYTATGKPEKDKSELGLHFYDEKPGMVFRTRSATNRSISIEPGVRDDDYAALYRVNQDSVIWGFNPHMHLRGSRFAYSAVLPDGTKKPLLNVPNYDFNWQTEYRLAEPIQLPAGSRIMAEGAFDNSATNPNNPDPEDWVYWGDQSWEEMFIGFISYSPLPDGDVATAKREKVTGPITEAKLIGTEWRFMRFRILFESDGLIIVDDAMNGDWKFVDDDTIQVNVGDRGIVIEVDGNQMKVQGFPLKQLTD